MYRSLIVLTLLAANVAAAEDVGVFPVGAVNLNEGEAEAIGAMIASAYARQTRTPVRNPSELGPVLQRSLSETDSAAELGLTQYIHVEAVRMERAVAVYASLRDPAGRELSFVRMTMRSLDDLPAASQRMAAALDRRDPTGHESRANAERARTGDAGGFVEKLFGARIAIMQPAFDTLYDRPSLLAQFDARLEQTSYFLELGAGFWFPSQGQSLGGLVAQLGACYYLTDAHVAPYVGAGVSPRIFIQNSHSAAGLALNARIGLMLMRHASIHMYLEAQIDQNLIDVRPRYGDYDDVPSSRSVLPTEFTLATGVGF